MARAATKPQPQRPLKPGTREAAVWQSSGGKEQLEAEEALCKRFSDRIEATERSDVYKEQVKCIQRNRGYVTGKIHDDGEKGLVRTNLVLSTIASIVPHVYARSPALSVSMTNSVPREQYKMVKAFAETLEDVLDRLVVEGNIEEGQLRVRGRSAVRSAMTTSIGWVKCFLQTETSVDPVAKARVDTIKDNYEQLKATLKDLADPEQKDELEANRHDMEQEMAALKVERQLVTACVVERILTEDVIILDESIKDWDYYVNADAIAHRCWLTKEHYRQHFGYDPPDEATVYHRAEKASSDKESANPKPEVQGDGYKTELYLVYEIWRKSIKTVYWWCQGCKSFCRDPVQPQPAGKRWYPFFGLAFTPVDGQMRPMSDVESWTELQDEYNTTRTNFAEHRKASVPVVIVRAGGQLSQKDVENVRVRRINDVIVVEGTPDRPIKDEIAALEWPRLDPLVYDTTTIRQDLDLVAGLSDAARGQPIEAKTLGEAEMVEQHLLGRTSDRQDVIEGWITAIATYFAEILLQALSPEQALAIAGEDGVWPEMEADDIFSWIKVQVRAGSTGKPDKRKEQEQWIQMLPEVRETIKQIWELTTSGNVPLAKSTLELLRETLSRFDEYLDLDRFIPPQLLEDDDQMNAMAQNQVLMAENEQLKLAMSEMQQQAAALMQENENLKKQDAAKAIEATAKVTQDAENMAAERTRKEQEQNAKERDARRAREQQLQKEARERQHQKDLKRMELDHDKDIEMGKRAAEVMTAKASAEGEGDGKKGGKSLSGDERKMMTAAISGMQLTNEDRKAMTAAIEKMADQMTAIEKLLRAPKKIQNVQTNNEGEITSAEVVPQA